MSRSLPAASAIFTCTFFQSPGGGKRDGLIHAIYGGIYGKVHDADLRAGPQVDRRPRSCPCSLHMGPAAPCGLTRYESAGFGPDYRDNLFACYFNLHKVSRHVLKPSGATFTTDGRRFRDQPGS